MPAQKAASVQARVASASMPPEQASQGPGEISETFRSELPSVRYRMLLLFLGAGRPRAGPAARYGATGFLTRSVSSWTSRESREATERPASAGWRSTLFGSMR